MEAKMLLTGFEPFGGDQVNPSWDVAESLDGAEIHGLEVVARILPVEWGKAKQRIEALIEETRPVVVLSLGLSAGRAEVSVEKVALNYTSRSKDNSGVVHVERAIVEGAPDAYFATVPVEAVVEDINKTGIPARLSLSAGSYLCNYTFYCASRYVRETGRKTQVGFIHVPATPPMVAGKPRGGPSMAQGLIKQAVLQALTTIASSLTNCG